MFGRINIKLFDFLTIVNNDMVLKLYNKKGMKILL